MKDGSWSAVAWFLFFLGQCKSETPGFLFIQMTVSVRVQAIYFHLSPLAELLKFSQVFRLEEEAPLRD